VSGAERVLAVDIGGTKLAAAWVDEHGAVSGRVVRPTEASAEQTADELWARLCGVLDAVTRGERPSAVGVGCGGPMHWPAGLVSPLNIPAWRDFPLRDRLVERFGVPVRVHNDAVAFAAGEHWRGAWAGVRNLLAVVVSTGVGGGLVVDRRLVEGTTGNAGHVGHVVVDPHGPPCGCGGRGCVETIARGPALAAWARDEGWKPPIGEPADGRALVGSARDGDPIALAALTRGGQALGVAFASVTHVLELDVIVLGGGLVNAGSLLLGPLQEAFDRHARMQFARRCRIVASERGSDAGLVGAAALVLAGDRYWSAS
jgi:glucokinase